MNKAYISCNTLVNTQATLDNILSSLQDCTLEFDEVNLIVEEDFNCNINYNIKNLTIRKHNFKNTFEYEALTNLWRDSLSTNEEYNILYIT